MPLISRENLDMLYSLLESKVETCGVFLEIDTNLQPYVDSVGSEENKRPMCVMKRFTNYIWHTHPFSHKAYPSAEDILRVLKKRPKGVVIISSLVFTAWGIWEIHSDRTAELPEEWVKYYTKVINEDFAPLYHITHGGRDPLTRNSLLFLYSVIDAIEKEINENKFGFGMTFSPWNDVVSYFVREKKEKNDTVVDMEM